MAFAFAVALVAFIAGLLVLVSLPVDVWLSVDCRETWSGRATVRWLLGAVRVSKSVPAARAKAEKRPASAGTGKRLRKKPSEKRRIPWRRMRAALLSPGFAKRGLRFVADAARVLRVRSLRGSARIGLDDPADTGLLWSVIGPLQAGIAAAPFAQVRIEPDFAEQTLVAQGTANFRVIPVRLFVAAIAFLISPVTLRAAWAAVRQ